MHNTEPSQIMRAAPYRGKDDEFPEDHLGHSGDESRHMTHATGRK
jgi:hypothetical protein